MTETRKRSLATEGRPLGGSSVLQNCICYFPIAVIRDPDKKLLGRERVYLDSEFQGEAVYHGGKAQRQDGSQLGSLEVKSENRKSARCKPSKPQPH